VTRVCLEVGALRRHRILLVDDDLSIRFGMSEFLREHGYAVDAAATAAEAREAIRSLRPDAILLDHHLPDGTAIDLIPLFLEIDPQLPVLVMTGNASIEIAVNAVKAGAEHFLTKPVDLEALLILLAREIEHRDRRRRQMASERRDPMRAPQPFRGVSNVVRALEKAAHKLAESDSPVLILGEQGTGKKAIARWLHENGPRAAGAFVDVPCAALSGETLERELFGQEAAGPSAAGTGLLDLANRGTLFLDEIADLDPRVQPRLLEILETKRYRRLHGGSDLAVDIRLIAATHHNLAEMVRDERFHSELYFRVQTVPLHVPALRERPQDIPMLAHALMECLGTDLGRGAIELTPCALQALQSHRWPGNLRELHNVLEAALLRTRGSKIDASAFRFDTGSGGPGPEQPFRGAVWKGAGPAADFAWRRVMSQA
jgi:DNA-binding NtrC family response regulator